MVRIRPVDRADTAWLRDLQDEHWGGQFQVANGESYRPADLPGFVAEIDGERVGYAALRVVGDVASIGLIHSLRQRRGIGSALVQAVAVAAGSSGCRVLRAITTDDNRGAQHLYQALGFRVWEVREGAMELSRAMKPSIPLRAPDGTLITGEIEYELPL